MKKKLSKVDIEIAPVEKQPMLKFTEQAYLNYSMYVILDRALPNISDGLKPVQRRIVFAMSELGLKNTAKFKKSARTIGDVIGKYHPHGDTACYEALVLMSQPFSYRYPLIEGQGNFGSTDDPKSFAAMRYTEAKLSAYSHVLLSELEEGTVDWQPNFDGTLKEPRLLPARLPNILLNGTSGIAVGMSTDIPSHNLCEVVDACVLLLDNPNSTLEDITSLLPGPDFPTEAEIITPRKDLLEMYRAGTGAVRMRAIYGKEDDEIVITALPHQVSGSKVLEQIAAQMQAKKLPMLADLRDESDHEHPTRLVLVPRSNRIDVDELMSHLLATTDLEKSYRINLNMIGLDGKPQVKPLLNLLLEWIQYRIATVRKRLEFRLKHVEERLHILAGLLVVYLHLDEVIRIIRKEDEPKLMLMKKFKLSEPQVEALLEIRLRQLAKLEEVKIREEQTLLQSEQKELTAILASNKKLKQVVRKELIADKEAYGDKRKSPIVERAEAQALKEIDRLPNEPTTIILSEKGWVRAAKGHDIDPYQLSYKAGDGFLAIAKGRSNQLALFIDSTGRSYALLAHSLPSARGQGEPLTGRLNPPPGAVFIGTLIGTPEQQVVMASSAGYGFVTTIEELISKNRNGKTIMRLAKGALALQPQLVTDLASDLLAAVTEQGRLLVFPLKELPILPKGKGNKIIHIPRDLWLAGEEKMIGIALVGENQALKIHSGKQSMVLKKKDLEYYYGERGRRGGRLPRGYQRVDKLTVEPVVSTEVKA